MMLTQRSNRVVLRGEVAGTRWQVLYSYENPVAAIIGLRGFETRRHWSETTDRHIRDFLGALGAEVKPQKWFDTLLTAELAGLTSVPRQEASCAG